MKNNVYDDEPEPKEPLDTDSGRGGIAGLGSVTPSKLLVIGIIICAVIVMILIVTIVLKTRLRLDPSYKMDDSGRGTYQFAHQVKISTRYNPTKNTLFVILSRRNLASNNSYPRKRLWPRLCHTKQNIPQRPVG